MKFINKTVAVLALSTLVFTPSFCVGVHQNSTNVASNQKLSPNVDPTFSFTPSYPNAAPLLCSYNDTNLLTISADITKTWTSEKDVYIPATIINEATGVVYKPWKIAKDGFSVRKTVIGNILLGDASSIESIEESAFSGCSLAKKIDLPPNVVVIGVNAFVGCEAATEVSFKNLANVKEIGANAFDNCKVIGSPIILPSTIETIGDYAFRNCLKVSAIDIDSSTSISTIGIQSFQNCGADLTDSMSTPLALRNILSLGDEAFKGVKVAQINFVYDKVTAGKIKFGKDWFPTITASATVAAEVHFPEGLQEIITNLTNFGISDTSIYRDFLYLTQFSFEIEKIILHNNNQFTLRIISNYGSDSSWSPTVRGDVTLITIKPESPQKRSYIIKADSTKTGEIEIIAQSNQKTFGGVTMTASIVISVRHPQENDWVNITLVWTIPTIVGAIVIAGLWAFNKKKISKRKK